VTTEYANAAISITGILIHTKTWKIVAVSIVVVNSRSRLMLDRRPPIDYGINELEKLRHMIGVCRNDVRASKKWDPDPLELIQAKYRLKKARRKIKKYHIRHPEARAIQFSDGTKYK
jgi:hypothetical protein